MARSKQHVRSPHRGVIIVKRVNKSGVVYAARYKEPQPGGGWRVVQKIIDSVENRSDKTRRDYCVRLSENLHRQLSAIGCGDELPSNTPIDVAIVDFLKFCAAKRLRPKTIKHYRYAADLFREGAAKRNLSSVEKIRKADLDWLYEFILAHKKSLPRKGGLVGERIVLEETLAKSTVTGILKPIKIMCHKWRTKGWLKVDLDEARAVLANPKADELTIGFLEEIDCRKLLEAALAHDAKLNTKPRNLKGKTYAPGSIPQYKAVAPLFLFYLLTGLRREEAQKLTWEMVDLNANDSEGHRVGELRITAEITKTKTPRTVGLEVCPSIHALLTAMSEVFGNSGYVFGGNKRMHSNYLQSAILLLIKDYGVREFSLQNLRQTTATFLTNAPGIYRGASVYRSARQLGHSVDVAQRRYVDERRFISPNAHTLEQALGIEELAAQIVASVAAPHRRRGAPTFY